ncbi:hypothetical protein ELI_3137 [Eubacterium callanderi]|uniref:Uncharacterized protein n=1 Tax=Eubacterium callanderi TaxID=53442 RepID=E3GEJ0_9FIRM|nr:hypothetical protein ELI_3137 [Eubacterium callanderi]OEZ05778.1 hypothetical protein BUME_08750 [[Butyribacterium] methylotrophicum]
MESIFRKKVFYGGLSIRRLKAIPFNFAPLFCVAFTHAGTGSGLHVHFLNLWYRPKQCEKILYAAPMLFFVLVLFFHFLQTFVKNSDGNTKTSLRFFQFVL